MIRIALLACLTLGACDALPRDPEGTSQRIATQGHFLVGTTDPSARTASETGKLIKEIERRTGARSQWVDGAGEALLKRLDGGSLDLAVGRFAETSPWLTDVGFGPPLSASGVKGDRIELKAAMRNGESRWIMTVERASRAISAEARAQ